MTFTTESGSTYEVDLKDKKIRRVEGKDKPTERVGEKQWKTYKDLVCFLPSKEGPGADEIYVGQRAIIVWPDSTPVLEETRQLMKDRRILNDPQKCTITSRVTKILN